MGLQEVVSGMVKMSKPGAKGAVALYNFSQMVSDGYHYGAPSAEVADIDAPIAERYPCPKCDSPMRYEAYHKRNGSRCTYIALAVCNCCGQQIEF